MNVSASKHATGILFKILCLWIVVQSNCFIFHGIGSHRGVMQRSRTFALYRASKYAVVGKDDDNFWEEDVKQPKGPHERVVRSNITL